MSQQGLCFLLHGIHCTDRYWSRGRRNQSCCPLTTVGCARNLCYQHRHVFSLQNCRYLESRHFFVIPCIYWCQIWILTFSIIASCSLANGYSLFGKIYLFYLIVSEDGAVGFSEELIPIHETRRFPTTEIWSIFTYHYIRILEAKLYDVTHILLSVVSHYDVINTKYIAFFASNIVYGGLVTKLQRTSMALCIKQGNCNRWGM
jgi:hypothetical protein